MSLISQADKQYPGLCRINVSFNVYSTYSILSTQISFLFICLVFWGARVVFSYLYVCI